MKIAHHTVVCFHFTLKNDQGDTLENSAGGEPRVYLHGAGNLMPKLEQALEGLEAGSHIEVALEAPDAFGLHQESLIQRVAVKHLRGSKRKLAPGDLVQMDTGDGPQAATIIKMGKFQATVDTNHPLAGQAITFVIDIDRVRAATTEEIAHGHAHGPDGHSGH